MDPLDGGTSTIMIPEIEKELCLSYVYACRQRRPGVAWHGTASSLDGSERAVDVAARRPDRREQYARQQNRRWTARFAAADRLLAKPFGIVEVASFQRDAAQGVKSFEEVGMIGRARAVG